MNLYDKIQNYIVKNWNAKQITPENGLKHWLFIQEIHNEVPRWISAKDELPKDEQQVIAGFYDDDGIFQQFMDVFNSKIWHRKKSDFERYTHWMPLLEPPKN